METSPAETPAPRHAHFDGALGSLGAALGAASGYLLARPLHPLGIGVQMSLGVMVATAFALGLGAWDVRWRRIPVWRLLSVLTLVGCVAFAMYRDLPEPEKPVAQVLSDSPTLMDATGLAIGGLAPEMTRLDIEGKRGVPEAQRKFAETLEGVTIQYTELTYKDPDVHAFLISDQSVRVTGPVMTMDGFPFLAVGDPRSKVHKLLGEPPTHEAAERGRDEYILHHPRIMVEHAKETVTTLSLGGL